jgi:hypothetical protein
MNLLDLLKNTAAYLSRKTKDAIDWYRNKILSIGKKDDLSDPDNRMKKVGYPEIGKLLLFSYYDPKYKDELSFWDIYPLVIPLEPPMVVGTKTYKGEAPSPSFLGLNLHYLPPSARANLLQSLMDLRTNDKYDDTTKLNISYRLLKGAANQFSGFENCLHRYMMNRITSSFHEIHPSDWDRVVLLPLQKWVFNPNRAIAARKRPPY